VSDIPVAVLCSGGLDSSIIYHYVKENTDDYKVFFVDNGTDSDYIGLLNIPSARLVKLPIHALSYDAAIFVNQTPVDLGSVHPQYCLAKAIKEEGYSVVLSGDGADELFGGYGRAQRYNSQLSDINELIHYHLPRLDRIMMSQTIELRSPWLSWEVMDFALQLPYNLRQKKDYLKATFCDIIPKPIIQRAKEPLKINTIREDEWKARVSSLKSFLSVIDGIFPSPDLDQLIAEER
jgi:asparagine synthase (glutamine-hydrolysing)